MANGEPPEVQAQRAEQLVQVHLLDHIQLGDHKWIEGDGHAGNKVLISHQIIDWFNQWWLMIIDKCQ
jgi:hypothetical protein